MAAEQGWANYGPEVARFAFSFFPNYPNRLYVLLNVTGAVIGERR